MKTVRRTFLLSSVSCGCLLTVLSPWTVAGPPKGPPTKKVESKPQQDKSAVTVNFPWELGLGFPGLTTLGVRIEQARQHYDPVGLALLAEELRVAEKVAGKQAALVSGELMKEALQLAKVRYDRSELKAVAMLAGGRHAKELLEVAEKAEKEAAENKKSRETGEIIRWMYSQVRLESRCDFPITVYVQGRYVATLDPFGDFSLHLPMTRWEMVYFSARGGARVWRHTVRGVGLGYYKWTLLP